MKLYLWIGLGSALGGMVRHWVATTAAQRFPGHFPWGTFFINLVGSLVIGIVAAAPVDQISTTARTFLMVGVLGGFTTFSAFSLQTVNLWIDGNSVIALVYALASVIGCPGAAWIGWTATTRFWHS